MKYLNALLFFCPLVLLGACENLRTVEHKEGTITERYTVDNEGRRHGEYRKFIGGDTLFELSIYHHGLLDGVRTIYDKDGNVEITETYVRDTLHGPYRVYDDNGEISREGDYEQGVMRGVWKRYYPGTRILEEVTFEDNQENGPFTEYYENGNLKAKGTYLNGDFEHDTLYLYQESGALMKKMLCNHGICKTLWQSEAEGDEG